MNLRAAGLVLVVMASGVLAGCGAGAAAQKPSAPDVFVAMDAELARAIGTATLTSDNMVLPESRLSVAQWEEEEPAAPALRTWGAPDVALREQPAGPSASLAE